MWVIFMGYKELSYAICRQAFLDAKSKNNIVKNDALNFLHSRKKYKNNGFKELLTFQGFSKKAIDSAIAKITEKGE